MSESKKKSSKKKKSRSRHRKEAKDLESGDVISNNEARKLLKAKASPANNKLLTYIGVGVSCLLLLVLVLKKFRAWRAKMSPPETSAFAEQLSEESPTGDSFKEVHPVQGKSKLDYEKEETNLQVILSGKDLLSVRRRFGSRADNLEAQKQARKDFTPKQKQCVRIQAAIQPNEKKTYYTPKKVFDLPVLQRSLKHLGYEHTTDLKTATIALKGVPRLTFRQLKVGQQYYDMVASLGKIGSKKKTQLATLRNHVKKFGCSFDSLGLQPKSFDMNRPSDCKRFFDASPEDKGKMWVFKSCKNGEGSKGQGIIVVDDLGEYRETWAGCESNAFNYVAQEYIEKPLLLKQKKFDMRAYVYVASTTPFVVFFNPGYIRRSLATYNAKSTDNKDVLTNVHIQITRDDYSPADAMWSFPEFIEYLKETNQCDLCGDIEIQIAKMSRLVFDAAREFVVRHAGSFQIVGLDFMMDANLRPYFIEGNVSPGLGSHELKWKKNLMDDLLSMMYEQATMIAERPDEFDLRLGDRIYGTHDNYWQLLVHEQHELCDKQKHTFDPCKEFSKPWHVGTALFGH